MARWVQLQSPAYFYPRPPRGGRPLSASSLSLTYPFLSTPSARRATGLGYDYYTSHKISIHALREEGDNGDDNDLRDVPHFYPRPPRGGRRRTITSGMGASKFLSTPSARRATVFPGARSVPWLHFYPRPPRGGRHPLRQTEPLLLRISIHALREEGDDGPVGTAVVSDTISIHALREEGDLPEKATVLRSLKFLSTPSARRATAVHQWTTGDAPISIHALREEGDQTKR